MNPDETPAERLKRLEDEVARLKNEVEHTGEPEPLPDPEPWNQTEPEPEKDDPEAAEALVRQAKVSEIRGNKREALDQLRQAAKLAPNTASVLAALGEALLNSGLHRDAVDILKKAKELEPTNARVETLYAKAVLGSTADPFLQFGAGGSPVAPDYATARAGMLSFFIPGLGQIVMGQTTKGWTYLIGWLISVIVAIMIPNGLGGLLSLAKGASGNPNMLVLFPLGLSLIFWLSSVYDATAQAKTASKPKVERPKPPVDLPFE